MTQFQSQTFIGQSQQQTQAQIAELMKPIKDLAQVWQIDITPYIDGFAIQLTNEIIQNIDFREAALIIQQTTSLFAKKVDFLYEFVNQILISQPGKQKRRRTTLVQANDLVLNYDYEKLNDNKFAEFFETYSLENPKIVQKKNLYLLPKQPYTVLQTRKDIVENNDIRISPIYNAIQQDYVFLLEQWDRDQLTKILENDVNAQPINYITPVHPKYFNMKGNTQHTQQQIKDINTFTLQSQLDNFDDQGEYIQLINSQNNIDINEQNNEPQDVEINVFNDVADQLQEQESEQQSDANAQPGKIKIKSIKEFIKSNPINKNSSQKQLKENLNAFQQLLNQQYAKLQKNSCSEVDITQMKKGFQKIQLNDVDFTTQNAQFIQKDNALIEVEDSDDNEIEAEDLDDIEPFYIYYTPKNLFNISKSQTGIIRKYILINKLLKQQVINSQTNISQALMSQNQATQLRRSEQPDIQQVPIHPLPSGDGLDNINPIFFTELQFDTVNQQRSQSGDVRYSQQTQQKKPSRFIYSHEYVVWVRKLQEQLESATKFDVIEAKNQILENCQNPVDIQTLSETLDVDSVGKQSKQKTNQIKLARCFMSSLFLASEGKISFESDQDGKLFVKQNEQK